MENGLPFQPKLEQRIVPTALFKLDLLNFAGSPAGRARLLIVTNNQVCGDMVSVWMRGLFSVTYGRTAASSE